MEEINILLLGESGVGKSTFINAFANYLKFPSLDEAKSGDLEILIPFRVKVGTNNNLTEVTVGGNDKNESLIEGDSSTLGCRVYRFCIGDKVIRLIDTPGIGDTKGVKQDKINLENILAYINQFQYLNGICMLFKPTQSRLTDGFTYCVKALLSQLHKSVKDNFIFCFTHTKGSNFQPGDTLTILKKLIKTDLKVELKTDDNTIYCFDNESLSFIVNHKEGIKFDKFIEMTIGFSWEKSVDESQRLLRYLRSLTPCNMSDSESLYNARVMVSNLAMPMVLMPQNITKNRIHLKEEINRIGKIKNPEDLRKELRRKKINLVTSKLKTPRVKCTTHSQICHENCNCWGCSKAIVYPCNAFNLISICRMCNGYCSSRNHIYETYETKEVIEWVINKEVEEDIINNSVSIKTKENLEKSYRDTELKMVEEYETVKHAKKIFTEFLIRNTLAAFDDVYLKCLQSTKNKLEKDASTLNNNFLKYKNNREKFDKESEEIQKDIDFLEKEIEKHENQVRKIKEYIQISPEISPDEIFILKDKLCNLPISGPTFKTIEEVEKIKLEYGSNEKSVNYINSRFLDPLKD
ncbi:7772_t:CDS:1 [Cetraspora pellucida]|uniref:7772_t:CDS:1 n=1 Tax=Cetraspora pellucida TaxID=1433469 RepID=A0A9N9HWB0_9GLOM|nr:7772_t:CDS:1 [Cetraspora pellucida]